MCVLYSEFYSNFSRFFAEPQSRTLSPKDPSPKGLGKLMANTVNRLQITREIRKQVRLSVNPNRFGRRNVLVETTRRSAM